MDMPQICLDQLALSRFEDAIKREWLVTNGLGGYASSTVLGLNTRKYHGLLIAAFHPPSDRRVCLEKLDEDVSIGNDTYLLGMSEFQNGFSPEGYDFLTQFAVSPFPTFTYDMRSIELQKTVFMPHGKNAAVILYKILNRTDIDAKFRVFPLLNWRHFHCTTERPKTCTEPAQSQQDREVYVKFDSPKSALLMTTIGGQYRAEGRWIEGIFYREEAARGESCLDDCYQSGVFSFEAKAGKNSSFAVIAVADENVDTARRVMAEMPTNLYDMNVLLEREVERRDSYLAKFRETHSDIRMSEWLSVLVLATDKFIVKWSGIHRKSVIAGYHWFEGWGRDAFVSLPGLMLVTGRFQDAREVLLGFSKYCKDGLIPNYVPDLPAEPAYNSVDASLWFVNAVLQYLKYTGDFNFVRERLWETLRTIIDSHLNGTVLDIHVDGDGLLSHGGQLTWMDAAVDGKAVTPRAGKAVEVQALWYNALRIMELLANRFDEKGKAEKYAVAAEKAKKSFEKFWNPKRNCLFDVISGEGRDDSLRPNQIVAVSLDFSMLDDSRNKIIVDFVQCEFLTPFGLRTLVKNDSRYMGVYAGDRRSRDRAYHNGTVWPWLLGPFSTAFVKVRSRSEHEHDVQKIMFKQLFSKQILEASLGTISEIFDGDPPHIQKGCVSQAWSVAEPLRAYVEDVVQDRPRYEMQILQGLR